MIASRGGRYFFSSNLLTEIVETKAKNETHPWSILFYILKTIAANNNYQIEFFGLDEGIRELEKKWEKDENVKEPAMKKLIIRVPSSTKFENDEDSNLLDVVSDIALSESPNDTFLLVTEKEHSELVKTNVILNFSGFGIYTPEQVLKFEGLFPFDKHLTGKIQKIIDKYCKNG